MQLNNPQGIGSTQQRPLSFGPPDVHQNEHNTEEALMRKRNVPVILGVMSQCPDALYCEAVFDKVLHQVGNIVDLSLTFIGRINPSEPLYGVTCRHGSAECTGNIHELCTISKYPNDRDIWWNFVTCSNSFGRFEVGKEYVSRACASKVGINWDDVKGCTESEEGVELLKESVKRTHGLGIVNSCTVLLNGRKRCVRDDEQWKDCKEGSSVDDFVRSIQEEYNDINGRS